MEVKKNIWKFAFFALLSSLAIFIITVIIAFYFFLPATNSVEPERQNGGGDTMFVISSTKDKLNLFLAEQLSRGSNNHFQIFLSEYVMLEAMIPIFGQEISFQLYLEPELYGDGDLMLKSHSFHVGEFQLPSQTLFRLIANTISFPEWIEIDTNKEMIILNITEINALESMFIKVRQFDLERDIIEFELASIR